MVKENFAQCVKKHQIWQRVASLIISYDHYHDDDYVKVRGDLLLLVLLMPIFRPNTDRQGAYHCNHHPRHLHHHLQCHPHHPHGHQLPQH